MRRTQRTTFPEFAVPWREVALRSSEKRKETRDEYPSGREGGNLKLQNLNLQNFAGVMPAPPGWTGGASPPNFAISNFAISNFAISNRIASAHFSFHGFSGLRASLKFLGTGMSRAFMFRTIDAEHALIFRNVCVYLFSFR